MSKQPIGSRDRSFLYFTAREIKFIGLLSYGWEHREIAELTGCTMDAVRTLVWRVYPEAGIKHNVATLTRWAIENCLDGPLPPERPEDLPRVEPKAQRKGRIRFNRIPT